MTLIHTVSTLAVALLIGGAAAEVYRLIFGRK